MFIKKFIYFYSKDIFSQWEETEICHKCSQQLEQSWSDARSQVLLQVFHVDEGAQGYESSSTAFQSHKQGAGFKVKQLGLKLMPVWDPGTFQVEDKPEIPLHWLPNDINSNGSNNCPYHYAQQTCWNEFEIWLCACFPSPALPWTVDRLFAVGFGNYSDWSTLLYVPIPTSKCHYTSYWKSSQVHLFQFAFSF